MSISKRRAANPPPQADRIEITVGAIRMVAQKRKCRLALPFDLSKTPRARLDRALRAFEEELNGRASVRQL